MEESEYKSAYGEIASNRCEFEKTLTHNKATCALARHFWLADREGYACKSSEASAKCREILLKLRENSRFVLKLPQTSDKLPHNMEIRVQVGGMQGIQALLEDSEHGIEDINALVTQAVDKYGGVEALPYSDIVPFVGRYQGRKSRK